MRLLPLMALLMIAAGCASTGAPKTLAERGYDAGRHGTVAYIATRKHMPTAWREAARQVYIAYSRTIDAADRDGEFDAVAALAYVVEHEIEPDLRPLARELVREIVERVKRRVPEGIGIMDSWVVAVSVRNGIRDVLETTGIDPDKAVGE